MFPPGTFLWKPRLSSHVVDVELQVASLHDSQYWGKLEYMRMLESNKVETRNFQNTRWNNEMLCYQCSIPPSIIVEKCSNNKESIQNWKKVFLRMFCAANCWIVTNEFLYTCRTVSYPRTTTIWRRQAIWIFTTAAQIKPFQPSVNILTANHLRNWNFTTIS